ncbi:MAG: SprT family zinc-dependent metalloprotease [Erysipelotrichaceae bacterium]
MEIKIGDYKYPIIIKRKRIKHMYLRVTSNNEVVITCNNRYSLNDILKFVDSKSSWILKSLGKQERIKNSKYNIFNKESIFFLNVKKKLQIIKSNKNFVIFDDEFIKIYTVNLEEDYVKKVFYNSAKDYLIDIINKLRNRWDLMLIENNINIKPEIVVKKLKSRWGFCIPSKNKVTINSYLIHYSKECIDYILLHEYAHFIQANHSKKFYGILFKYMPNYKEYENVLKSEIK